MKTITAHGVITGVRIENPHIPKDGVCFTFDGIGPAPSCVMLAMADDRALLDATRSFAPGTKVKVTLEVDEG